MTVLIDTAELAGLAVEGALYGTYSDTQSSSALTPLISMF